jgi:hypothetical protein
MARLCQRGLDGAIALRPLWGVTDIHTQQIGGGMLSSGAATAVADGDDPAALVLAASLAAPTWHVLDGGGALHLQLPPGAAIPPEAGRGDLAWEVARSLAAPATGAPVRATIAAASGAALDAVVVVTALGGEAARLAASLAAMPLPALEEGADAVWDRLGHAARRVQAWRGEGRLAAAALAYRGRGRLIGGLTGDLLIRFGVSAWR